MDEKHNRDPKPGEAGKTHQESRQHNKSNAGHREQEGHPAGKQVDKRKGGER
ncbi:MAG TPA: hypothetical protein VM434_06155 [Beijerinckiaceae bacterium]|nr:hypothetical protein [Beijerinckiaceae bacterium]